METVALTAEATLLLLWNPLDSSAVSLNRSPLEICNCATAWPPRKTSGEHEWKGKLTSASTLAHASPPWMAKLEDSHTHSMAWPYPNLEGIIKDYLWGACEGRRVLHMVWSAETPLVTLVSPAGLCAAHAAHRL